LVPRDSGGSGSGARTVLAVLFLVNVLNFYDRQVLGAVLEPLRREFHLSDAAGWARSPPSSRCCTPSPGWPWGRLADTGSRDACGYRVTLWAKPDGDRRGLAASYAMLMATRLGVGSVEAVCAPAAASWIENLVPPRAAAHAPWRDSLMGGAGGRMLSFAIGGPVRRRSMACGAGAGGAAAVALCPAVLVAEGACRGAGACHSATAGAP